MNIEKPNKFTLNRKVEEQFGRFIYQRNWRNSQKISHQPEKRFFCQNQRLLFNPETHRLQRNFRLSRIRRNPISSNTSILSLKSENSTQRSRPKKYNKHKNYLQKS